MKQLLNIKLYKDKKIEKEYKNIKALLNNKKYTFKLDNIKTSISDRMFTRENDEFKFTLDILKKEATYYLKEKNILFDIEVLNLSSKNEDNNIILEYRLSSDDASFKIVIKIEGEINE